VPPSPNFPNPSRPSSKGPSWYKNYDKSKPEKPVYNIIPWYSTPKPLFNSSPYSYASTPGPWGSASTQTYQKSFHSSDHKNDFKNSSDVTTESTFTRRFHFGETLPSHPPASPEASPRPKHNLKNVTRAKGQGATTHQGVRMTESVKVKRIVSQLKRRIHKVANL
jgi:hypothetical protein